MSSEGAIKRRITITFLNNEEVMYSNEEYTWCTGDNSISISDKYNGELRYLYPYHTVRRIQQESVR